MSQLLRTVIMAAYSTLLFHYLRTLQRNEQDIQISYIAKQSNSLKRIMREIRKPKSAYTFVDTSFTRPLRLHTDLKYVLKWTTAFSHFNLPTVRGQQAFIDSNCTYINCFMTDDKSLLLRVQHFDAILFDTESEWKYHPVTRALHQKYIFTATEPSSEHRVCHPAFDSFYNWTWTYKLDSTIAQPFFSIYHKNGTLAGPKKDMQWITSHTVSERIVDRLMYKNKMVAWFVSTCKTRSGREKVADGLARALRLYNFTVDIYGWCGKRVCPVKNSVESCLKMLETEYYFYLAFESSKCEDYVSEKVLHALNHYTVPIVYGGANYSRFLPPGSYIDATTMDSHSLALLMIETMGDKKVYGNYFSWHEHYYYKENQKRLDVCQLCRSLNDPALAHAQAQNFTTWWNTGDDACY